MSKDFLAGQIRTTQIISSGSQAGKPSLLIVSASDSTSYNGEAIDNSTLLADVGTDVFLFVTGSKTDPSGFSAFPSGPRQNVTLFGGDVVISGTMFAEHSMIEVDGNVTGSMSISGSLFVSRSISINEGLTVNESGEAGAENDFRVETSNFTHAIFADASTDQILIHTSSEAGSDVSFYISGSVGGKDSATHKGVSLFAGDVVVSGTVYGPDGRELGAEHVGWFTGSAGNNVGGGAGAGWISTTGSLAVSGSDLYISQYIKHIGDTNTNIAFENDVVKIMAGDMGVLATDPSEDVVLIGSHGGASTKFGRVLILSGGAAGSANESNASDLNFFVSGTIGSKDSASVRGTAVFGGDMVVSGGLDVHGATFVVDEVNDRVGINTTSPTVALAVSGSTAGDTLVKVLGSEGVKGLVAGYQATAYSYGATSNNILSSDFVISGASDSGYSLLINESDGRASFGYKLLTKNGTATPDYHHLYYDVGGGNKYRPFITYISSSTGPQVLLMSGTIEADANFYVSGSIGSKDSAIKGTSVFGGDLVISGALHGGSALQIGSHEDDLGAEVGFFVSGARSSRDADESVTLFGGDTVISGTLYALGSNASVPAAALGDTAGATGIGSDTHIWVSGSIGTRGSGTRGTSIFGGDLFVSGGLYASSSVTHTISTSKNDEEAIHIFTDGGTSEQVSIESKQGTGVLNYTSGRTDPSINIVSSVGGIGIESTANLAESVVIAANGGTSSQIVIKNKTGTASGYAGNSSIRLISEEGGIEFDAKEGYAFSSTAANAPFYVSVGGDSQIDTSGGTLTLDGGTGVIIKEAGTAVITISDDKDVIIQTSDDGAYGSPDLQVYGFSQYRGGIGQDTGDVTFNELGAGYDFRVESNDHTHMLFVSGNLNNLGRGFQTRDNTTPRDLVHIRQGDYEKSAGLRIEHLMDAGQTYTNSGSIIFSSLNSSDSTTRTALGEITMEPLGNLVLRASKQDTDIIFKVNDGGTSKELMRLDGSTSQVLILSGGAASSTDEAAGSDVSFYVSGSTSSKDSTSVRGTTVFGGDVTLSGTLYALASAAGEPAAAMGSTVGATGIGNDAHLWVSGAIGSHGTSTRGTSIFGGDLVVSGGMNVSGTVSGSIHHTADGLSYLIAGSNVTITSASNGQVTIASSGGGGASSVGWVGSAAGQIDTTGSLGISGTLSVAESITHIGETGNKINFVTGQVLILSGGAGASANEANGTDVNFFVSGTVGSKDSAAKGTAVFGGDTVVSGTLVVGEGSTTGITTHGSIIPATNNTYDLGSSSNRFQNIYTGDLHLRNERGNWTIVEEEDYLCVVNNKSGKKFKMALIPIEE